MSLRRSTALLAAAPWARVLAVACVLLVVLLGAAAQNPWLHDGLHHLTQEAACDDAYQHDADSPAATEKPDAHDCAVTLFAQGLLHVAAQAAVTLPADQLKILPVVPRDRLQPDSTRHLLPWSQAPPASC